MKNQYVQSETGFNRFKWDHYSNMRFWLWKKTLWKQIKASFKKYHSPNWITWTTPDCHFISLSSVSCLLISKRPQTWNITTRFIMCDSLLAWPTFDHSTDPETDTAEILLSGALPRRQSTKHQPEFFFWVNVFKERRVARDKV